MGTHTNRRTKSAEHLSLLAEITRLRMRVASIRTIADTAVFTEEDAADLKVRTGTIRLELADLERRYLKAAK